MDLSASAQLSINYIQFFLILLTIIFTRAMMLWTPP